MLLEPFMQRALLGAAILTPLCALLGVYVTARRMAFFSDTVAHASLAGVALSFLVGLASPTPGMLAVSLVVAGIIIWLRERSGLSNDTIMALLLTGSVALGTALLSRLHGYRGELHRTLFGDIIAIDSTEIGIAFALLIGVTILSTWALSPLSLISVNEDLAHVSGIPVRWFNYGFILILTLTVTVTIRLVGILLVGALLVIPAATARQVSANLRQEIWLAIACGALAGIGGVLVSHRFDIPCGPAIVLLSLVQFTAALAWTQLRRRRLA